jgi:hypothetical protein
MSLGSRFRPDGPGRPYRVRPVRCGNCGTDRHLIIRSVTEFPDPPDGVVMTSYTCGRCGGYGEHPTRIADLSNVLANPAQISDVLIFGSYYMHCRQPMEKAGSELRRLSVPRPTEGEAEDPLELYFSTRVLRCVCGFQMELPE